MANFNTVNIEGFGTGNESRTELENEVVQSSEPPHFPLQPADRLICQRPSK